MLVLYKKSGSNGIEFLNNPNAVEKFSSFAFYCSNFSSSAAANGVTDFKVVLSSLLCKAFGVSNLSTMGFSNFEAKCLKINLYFKELFLDVSSIYVMTENEKVPYSAYRFDCKNYVYDGTDVTLSFQFLAPFGNSSLSIVLRYDYGKDEWFEDFSSQEVFNGMRINSLGCCLLSS